MPLGGQSPNEASGAGGGEAQDGPQGVAAGPSSSSPTPRGPTHQPNTNPNPDPPLPPPPPPGIKATNEPESDNTESTYHLKWIKWNEGKIPIVMQSRNGPCPLIATINVLLLREKVKLPTMLEQITANQLLTYLGECIMDSSFNITADMQNNENAILNMEQNIHDAMEILPKLNTGIDVNIRFTGITDFEYTPECIIFDLLRIPLYHGWLSDPNLIELQNAIGNQSYNQLVDNIITNKTSVDPEISAKVLIAEEFLERTASQLTLHGLNELKSNIKDNEIGILFRNNHFLTLFKREDEIYTLVTDHGYLTEDNIIWEILDNIEGAGRFFDSNFQVSEVTNKQVFEFNNAIDQQLENDFLMALSLKVNDTLETQPKEANSDEELAAAITTAMSHRLEDDFELAKRLQAEEDTSYRRIALSPREQKAAEAKGSKSRQTGLRSEMSHYMSEYMQYLRGNSADSETAIPPQSSHHPSGALCSSTPATSSEISPLNITEQQGHHHEQAFLDQAADERSTSASALNSLPLAPESLANQPSSASNLSQLDERRLSQAQPPPPPPPAHHHRPNSSRRQKSEKNLKESNCIVN